MTIELKVLKSRAFKASSVVMTVVKREINKYGRKIEQGK